MERIKVLFYVLFVFSMSINIQGFTQNQKIKIEGSISKINKSENSIKIVSYSTKNSNDLFYFFTENTKLTDSEDEKLEFSKLRIGTIITLYVIDYNKIFSAQTQKINEIQNLKINGILEKYIPLEELAVIDGRKVKLEQTAIVLPQSIYKEKQNGFSNIKLGSIIKGEGKYKTDGLIYASKIEVEKNKLSETDIKLKQSMNADFSSSLIAGNKNNISSNLDDTTKRFLVLDNIKFEIISNEILQNYVAKVGNKLIPKYQKDLDISDSTKINFSFLLVKSPLVNAFALPNGIVVIFSGLFSVIENEAQFAAVLGHEIAHCIYKHSAQRLENQSKNIEKEKETRKNANKLAQVVSIVATGSTTNDKVSEDLIKFTTKYLNNNYSKEKEEQADRVGLYYMLEAKYNPFEAINCWRNFSEFSSNLIKMDSLKTQTKNWLIQRSTENTKNDQTKIVESLVDNNFSDHPKAKKRLKNLSEVIEEINLPEEYSVAISKDEFEQAKKSILKQ